MPQASNELRDRFKDDGDALEVLDRFKDRGVYEIKGMIFIPSDLNDAELNRAINYLCDEWDYAGQDYEPDPSGHPDTWKLTNPMGQEEW